VWKLITAQEEERKRVSRELHDDVNQKLAVLGMAISKLRQRVPESLGYVSDELSQLENRTYELAQAVHQLSHQLHPSILDHFGLVAALESCCNEFHSHTGIDVKLTVDEIESIPPDVALCLYRITQESLRNVAKHSGAKSALVKLTYTHDGIQLFISDAGAGFDLHQAKGKGGLGLVSIDERVRMLQGNLRIEAKPGFGTRLLVNIPHSEEVRQAAQNGRPGL
jgi:signal transduction histidine kinase